MSFIAEVAPISDLRHRQNEIIEALIEGPVILTQRGHGTAVLLSMEQWKQMMRQLGELWEVLEEAEDVRAANEIEARIASGEESLLDWTEAEAELNALPAEHDRTGQGRSAQPAGARAADCSAHREQPGRGSPTPRGKGVA
jgi:prevent-host-death family protein